MVAEVVDGDGLAGTEPFHAGAFLKLLLELLAFDDRLIHSGDETEAVALGQ